MRRFMLSIAIMLAVTVAPGASRAGDCSGDHYTYDHGECTDMSGETFSVMEKAYDESYHQSQSMIDRDRPGASAHMSAGSAGRGLRRSYASGLVDLSSFRPVDPSPFLYDVARGSKPAERAANVKKAATYLAMYRAYAPSHGFWLTNYPSAILFGLEAAYIVYDGDRFKAPRLRTTAWDALSERSVAAFGGKSQADKQRVNDLWAVSGVELLYEAAVARKHHDAHALAETKHAALALLNQFWHGDASKTHIDDVACLETINIVGTCEERKFFISGGAAGSFAFPHVP